MFVKKLKTQAMMWEFGDERDMIIFCRCVFWNYNVKLKENMLQDSNISLVRAVDMIRASEVTKTQMECLATNKLVNVVSRADKRVVPTPAPRKIFSCRICGLDHRQICKKCGLKNYSQKVSFM